MKVPCFPNRTNLGGDVGRSCCLRHRHDSSGGDSALLRPTYSEGGTRAAQIAEDAVARMALGRLVYRLTSLVDAVALTALVWLVVEGLLGIELPPWLLILNVLVLMAHTERN